MALDKNSKILVVDDFATIRKILTKHLNAMGYEDVVSAESGAEALEIFEQEEVHFLITDWNMPEMTGLELVKTIRSGEKSPDLPVMMVTAEGEMEKMREASEVNVKAYLLKPFNAQSIVDKMEQIFPS